MKRLILGAVAILLLSTCPVQADLIVDAGTWNLAADTSGQEIWVSISGAGSVTNATVMEEIVGTSPLPVFTDGSIIDGTIFASNNTGSPSYAFLDQLAYLDVATNSGVVDFNGNGILAKLTVSTAGVASGDFPLILSSTSWGDTYVGTTPATPITYNAGSIHIVPVPEPSSIVLFLFTLASITSLAIRRRWAHMSGGG